MNIQAYRSSFTVAFISSDLEVTKSISEILVAAGYNLYCYLNAESFFQDQTIHPAHIVLLDFNFLKKIKNSELVVNFEYFSERIEKAQIIALVENDLLEEAADLYSLGLADIVTWPIQNARHFLRAIDRAAEVDYYIFLNDRLKERVEVSEEREDSSLGEGEVSKSFSLFALWMHELHKMTDSQQALRHVMNEIFRHLRTYDSDEGSDLLFFKYNSLKATLLLSEAIRGDYSTQQLGIELKKTEKPFSENNLLKPYTLQGLRDLMINGLKKKKFVAFPLLSGREVKGLLVLATVADLGQVSSDPYIRSCLEAYHHFERLLALKQKMTKVTVLDDQSEVFNRDYTIKKIREEISRARRLTKPVSLLLLSVDQFVEFQLKHLSSEVDRFVKLICQIFVKNSRLNDIVGRLNDNQFVLLLPHTDQKGATIKAERMRSMIEQADFSKVLSQEFSFTLSVGVSEYPSHCSDVDSMLASAEEALYKVMRSSANKIGIATAKGFFAPDFKS